MMTRAGETVDRAAQSTRRAASAVGTTMRHSPGRYAMVGAGLGVAWLLANQRRRPQALQDSPLLFGLVAMAAGALVGAALPLTQTERAYFGQARERVFESARTLAEQKARQFAQGR